MKVLIWAGLAITLLQACTRPAPPVAAPVAVDARGKTFAARSRTRIISLAPSCTEILASLGVVDRLVAVDSWSDFPPAVTQIAHLGGMMPSMETMVAYKPDLVVMPDSVPQLRDKLDSMGIDTFVVDTNRLQGMYDALTELGKLLGKEAEGRQIGDQFRDRLAAITRHTAGKPPVSVFVVMDFDNPRAPWTAGKNTFVDELIRLAGGRNIAESAQGAWIRFSLEALIEADPQWIVLSSEHPEPPAQALERLRKLPGWNRLQALRAGRLLVMTPDEIARPAPRIAAGVERLAKALHP